MSSYDQWAHPGTTASTTSSTPATYVTGPATPKSIRRIVSASTTSSTPATQGSGPTTPGGRFGGVVELNLGFKESTNSPDVGSLIIKYPVIGTRRLHLKFMRKRLPANDTSIKFVEYIDNDGDHAIRLEGILIKKIVQSADDFQIIMANEKDAKTLQAIVGCGTVEGSLLTGIPQKTSWLTFEQAISGRREVGSVTPGTGRSERIDSRSSSSSSSSSSPSASSSTRTPRPLDAGSPPSKRSRRRDALARFCETLHGCKPRKRCKGVVSRTVAAIRRSTRFIRRDGKG